MDYAQMITKTNPYEKAGIINRNFFFWIISLFNTGYRKELEVKDLWKNPQVDSSRRLGTRLQEKWNHELEMQRQTGRKPSFLRAIISAFGFWYFMSGSLSIISEGVIRVLQPIVMGYMIFFLEQYLNYGKLEDLHNFYICGALVVGLGIIFVILYHPYYFKMTRKGMQVRIACCHMIYRKALRLSHKALGQTTVGQMVNLLSNDVNRFDYSFIFVPFIVTAPLQAIITIIYLYYFNFSWTVLAGCSILLLYLPFQIYMGTLFSKLRARTAILTDERIRLMNELIPAMRVIKMYTWEKPFAKLVELARWREVAVIKKTALLRGVNMALFFVSSKAIVFVCFVVFVLQGYEFTPQHVFVAIALFGNLRTCLTLFMPYGISQGSEALISIRRLEEFLLLEEKDVDSDHINHVSLPTKPEDCGVWLRNVTGSWRPQGQTPTLANLNFEVTPGELLVIIGSVGSGKSSILMAILSEIPVYQGEVRIRGKISYASQQAWNFAGTVRENVIFGNRYDDAKYKEVLQVCALQKDLQLFPFGDQTIVGDRGVSLSGGQKARINLARCLYADADIYLLDDPLSAVDSAVSKHIFEKCIRGYLKHKTVILVTHQLQFIKQATKILVLKDGQSLGYGPFSELSKKGIDFVKISEEQEELNKKQKEAEAAAAAELKKSTETSAKILSAHYSSKTSLTSSVGGGGGDDLANFITGEALQQTTGELATSGSVKARIYWVYISSGAGFFMLTLLILSNLGTQLLFNGSDYFLALWTEKESGHSIWYMEKLTTHQCIIILSALVGTLFLLSLVRTTTFFTICMRSSITLHNRLFECLIRAPVSFFDSNPIGVLLNRCSRDMGIVDDLIPATAFDAVEIFVQMIGILLLVSLISPLIIPPTLVLVVIFYWVRKYYIRSARSIKRLEGVTRSPVFSHLANSLYGLSTVRAFGVQEKFAEKFDEYADCHTASWFLFISAARWFGIVLDWLCVIYLAAVTIVMSLTFEHHNLNPSEVGLCISYAITLSGMFQWGVRQSTELESQMTSVERIDEFSHIETEQNLELPPERDPPGDWPRHGAIKFDNVSLAYVPEAPPVLKNLTFEIHANEKIGIVGRTGAGKSSMISALFRLSPPTGTISIDGIDTGNISLTKLRNKLSIIPQEPVIFAGPIRRNLDPFNQHTDERLWEVLEEVQLKPMVIQSGGLDSAIAEGGGNLSIGQRQLFCLARAILKQNRVLVLDEATANVDQRTDLFIQDSIREKFANCTVLTIAHRLHTIMDSDRILVLDAGRLMEFDEPWLLLQNEKSLFANMVRMTGNSMAKNLREMARVAYELRRNKDDEDYVRKGSFTLSECRRRNAAAAAKITAEQEHHTECNGDQQQQQE